MRHYFGTAPPWARRADRGLSFASPIFLCVATSLLVICNVTRVSSAGGPGDVTRLVGACDGSPPGLSLMSAKASGGGARRPAFSKTRSVGSAFACCGAVCSDPSPNRPATMERNSGVSWSDPKPGTLSGLAKSHWFSAMPTKSRIVGSDTQTRRSAARVSSSGTPGARKARISLIAVIDSIDGKVAGSNSGGSASPCADAGTFAPQLIAAMCR